MPPGDEAVGGFTTSVTDRLRQSGSNCSFPSASRLTYRAEWLAATGGAIALTK